MIKIERNKNKDATVITIPDSEMNFDGKMSVSGKNYVHFIGSTKLKLPGSHAVQRLRLAIETPVAEDIIDLSS